MRAGEAGPASLLKNGLCVSYALVELAATRPLPDFTPEDTACHVRAFTEGGLKERFGSFFVGFAKP